MKTRILLMLTLLAGLTCFAQTVEVGGDQSGIWKADTIKVVGDVKVVDVLEVSPGTTVLFDGFYTITVTDGAAFEAKGSEDDSIRFTVADTTGLFVYNSIKGGWNGFRLEKTPKVLFDYCVLEYAKASDTTDMFGGAIRISNCKDVVIQHSTLRFNRAREHGGAVSAVNSHVVMTDCSVNDNMVYSDDPIYSRYGGALRFLKCDVELRAMEFLRNKGEGCIGGALSLDSCSVWLDRAVFADNIGLNGGGLYMMRSNHLKGRLSNLLFDGNFSRHFGGGLAFADTSPEVCNILVTNNDSEGVTCTGLFFYQYCSPTLTNCIVYGNYPSPSEVNQDTVQMWLWTFDDYAPEFRNCLIEGKTKYMMGADNIHVFEDIVDDDPLFVDALNHDFRLSEKSPCRDAGSTDTPEYVMEGLDLDGLWRVANRRIDIGPYEYTGAMVPSHLANSSQVNLVGNPLGAKSRVVFENEWNGDVVVTVYSITGRQAAQHTYHLVKSTCLDLGGLVEPLAQGVYLIEVSGEAGTFTLKAIK